jgi:dienelactone hydrolase
MTDATTTALSVLEKVQAGQFEDIRAMFARPLQALVSAEGLETAWSAAIGQYGPLVAAGAPTAEPTPAGGSAVRIPLTFERGALTMVVAVGESGLGGLQLTPAEVPDAHEPWQPPSYVDSSRFDEREVMLGSDALAVPGTLTLPRVDDRVPAVVLLAGSGPNDRDETIARNKPFKDLAWGLASRGIAVLRFDKVTMVHGRQIGSDFTVADEYLPHALAAAELLRAEPTVDSDRVFVLGHSLGGTVAPRVVAADLRFAGMVIVAGGVQPMHWAAVRQLRYLASLQPGSAAAAEGMARLAEVVDSSELSLSTPAAELPFGVPPAYWLDLRGYDPVVVAAHLGKPMLILQGGRDYQVTIPDDLDRWRAGLADRPQVTIRVYDADDHFFLPGTGPSTPAEYERLRHMDPAVVADIGDWIVHR